MKRLSAFIAVCFILIWSLTGVAEAETAEDLRRQIAAKRAELAELELQLLQMEDGGDAHARPGSVHTAVATPVPRAVPSPDGEDEADRALERALVREGVFVLPPHTYEFTPQFSWAHWDSMKSPSVDNTYSSALGFRMGLPWQSQLSVAVPYVVNDERGGGTSSGFGDVGFMFSKVLHRETETHPALVGSIGWTSPTSNACCLGPIPYVSGFQGGVTASKRLDPLVAYASVSYFSSLSRRVAGTTVDPSDVIASRLGGSLAVTPATSLTAGINLSFLTDPPPGSPSAASPDRVLSTVDLGFSTIVWPKTLFSVSGQFGLTGNVPDFRITTAMPIRF